MFEEFFNAPAEHSICINSGGLEVWLIDGSGKLARKGTLVSKV